MNKYISITSILISALLLSACGALENILYLQDMTIDNPESIERSADITLQPSDMVSIVVSSRDSELASQFNLPIISYSQGGQMVNYNNRVLGYTVNSAGDIDFPVLGTLHVAGLTRGQVSNMIKNSLIAEELLKDPVVTIEFMNLSISILGEVRSPGRFSINRDRITLLEAISMAGDLTIQGKRNGVFVVREENGIRTNYAVDLRSAELFNSPVYYLKQNDAIYVQQNKFRAGQSTANENNFRSVAVLTSIASTLVSLAILLTRK